MARDRAGFRALSSQEIVERSGLGYRVVMRLSRLRTWDDVPIGVAVKFASACGVDLLNQKRCKAFFCRKGGKWAHLKKVPHRERAFIKKLLTIR